MGLFLAIFMSRRVQQLILLAIVAALVVWKWDDLLRTFGAGSALLLLVVLFM